MPAASLGLYSADCTDSDRFHRTELLAVNLREELGDHLGLVLVSKGAAALANEPTWEAPGVISIEKAVATGLRRLGTHQTADLGD